MHAILKESPRQRAANTRTQTPALLKGLIVTDRGIAMTPTVTPATFPSGYDQRLIASFDLEKTIPSYALGYRWDIVLRGRDATPMEK